jgi:amino acid transporter
MQKQTITLVRGLGLVLCGDFDHHRKRRRHGRFFESARDDLQRRLAGMGFDRLDRGWVLSLAGALTYAELSAMKPEAGGEYVFLRDAYGSVWSFLYGWMLIFVGKTGAQASVAVVFAIGLNDFLDGKFKTNFVQPIFSAIVRTDFAANHRRDDDRYFYDDQLRVGRLQRRIATALTFVKIALIAFVGVGAFVWVTGGTFSHFSMTEAGGACEGVGESVRYGSANYSFIGRFRRGDARRAVGL